MHVSLAFNGTLIVQALSFLVFAFLMDRLFFRPVLRALARRRDYVTDCQLEATKALAEGEQLAAERMAQLSEATRQAQATVAAAVASAEETRRERLGQASADARELVDAARREIQTEKERARVTLQTELPALKHLIKERVLAGE